MCPFPRELEAIRYASSSIWMMPEAVFCHDVIVWALTALALSCKGLRDDATRPAALFAETSL